MSDIELLESGFVVHEQLSVDVGQLVIRPTGNARQPWRCAVLLDGIEQEHVTKVELTIEVGDLPRLKLTSMRCLNNPQASPNP